MSNWEWVTLDQLGKISKGIQKHKPNFDPSLFGGKETTPLVGCKEVSESNLRILKCERHYNSKGLKQSKLFFKNTVCIVEAGNSSTDTAILKYPCCLSADLYGFNSYQEISDPRFIKYCFDYPKIKNQLLALAKSTTAQPHLTLSRLLSGKFPKPPFEIQKKIGDILSAYDEIMENHERQIEILEGIRTSIYKRWFIYKNDQKETDKLKNFVTITRGRIAANEEISSQPNKLKNTYPFFTSSKDSPKRINKYSYNQTAILISTARYFLAHLYRGKFEATSLTYFLLETIKFNLPNLHKASVGTNYKILKTKQLQDLKFSIPNKETLEKFNIICETIQTKIEKLTKKIKK